jgi:CO/xanthine dehydrogenase Mo-binding subunit
MGQGNAATNLQIAGSILGQHAEQVELVQPDTDRSLPSGSASASRCTYTFGNALIAAAEALKCRVLQRAADLFMAGGSDEMALVPGKVRNVSTGAEIPLARLAQFMDASERIATHRFRAPTAKEPVEVDERVRLHGFPHTLFSYAGHVAWVEVDELTGRVDVVRYLAVSDCGKIINPQIYEQQIQGAIAQGIGYALSEEIVVDGGIIRTPDLATFIIPTAADVPRIESIAVEIHEDTGPYGLKGVGEIATNGPLPAIANAVADACGVRVFTSPLTAERVLGTLSAEFGK